MYTGHYRLNTCLYLSTEIILCKHILHSSQNGLFAINAINAFIVNTPTKEVCTTANTISNIFGDSILYFLDTCQSSNVRHIPGNAKKLSVRCNLAGFTVRNPQGRYLLGCPIFLYKRRQYIFSKALRHN